MAIDNPVRPAGPQIAIVGGGIVGVILTLGLLRQNVPVRLYEQSGGWNRILGMRTTMQYV
jgi:salicylate hydroxylase